MDPLKCCQLILSCKGNLKCFSASSDRVNEQKFYQPDKSDFGVELFQVDRNFLFLMASISGTFKSQWNWLKFYVNTVLR